MTDLRKAAEMALEALEWNYGTDLENIENCMVWLDKMNATIPALRQALAQSKDQGVITYRTGYESGYMDASVALKREWVGLTQDDKNELFNNWWNKNQSFNKLIEDTEEKLMEKNNV